MKIGEMLGLGGNPLYQFLDTNRTGIGGALSEFGKADMAESARQGSQVDQVVQQRKMAEAERQKAITDAANQKNYTITTMGRDRPDLVAAVEGGMPLGEAWNHFLKKEPVAEGFTLGEGQVRYGPDGRIIAQGPTAASSAKPTSSMQEYEFARSQGYTGTFQQYETEMKKAGATSIDFNANQGTAAAYADRMAAADQVLSDPALLSAQTDIVEQGKSGIPVVGNFLTSPARQQAEQAERDFINAILRRESGAVIAESEFANARKQYFPQPGDSEAVIQQKARNRKMAIEGVARAAGPAYSPPPTMGAGGVVDYTTYFGSQ